MPRKGIERDIRIAIDLGRLHARRYPDTQDPPISDFGTPNVSPAGCGPNAGFRAGFLSERDTPARDNKARSSARQGKSGWIMTEGLGNRADLGKMTSFALGMLIRFPGYSSALASYEAKNREMLTSFVKYLTARPLDSQDITRLFLLYQDGGVGLGVAGISGPLTEKQATLFERTRNDEKRSNLRRKIHPLLQGLAWYLREGSRQGIEGIVRIYGTDLMDLFLNDLDKTLGSQDHEGKSEEIESSVDRINAVWQAMIKAGDRDDIRDIGSLVRHRGFQAATASFEVAADDESEVLLGTRNAALETYRNAPSFAQKLGKSGLGRFIASRNRNFDISTLGDLLRKVYYPWLYKILPQSESIGGIEPDILRKNLTENSAAGSLIYIFQDEQAQAPVYFTGEGLEMFKADPGRVSRLLSGQMQGRIIYTRVRQLKDGHIYQKCIIINPALIKGSKVEKEDGIMKYAFAIRQGDVSQAKTRYMDPYMQMEFLRLVGERLKKGGFNVVTPYFAERHKLYMSKAPGAVDLYDFYSSVVNGRVKEYDEMRTLIQDAVIELTNEARDHLHDEFSRYLNMQGIENKYNNVNQSFRVAIKTDPPRTADLYLDLAIRDAQKDSSAAHQGLRNWRFDEVSFRERIYEMSQAKIGGLDFEDIKSAMKSAMTLVDPVEMVWDDPDGNIFRNNCYDVTDNYVE